MNQKYKYFLFVSKVMQNFKRMGLLSSMSVFDDACWSMIRHVAVYDQACWSSVRHVGLKWVSDETCRYPTWQSLMGFRYMSLIIIILLWTLKFSVRLFLFIKNSPESVISFIFCWGHFRSIPENSAGFKSRTFYKFTKYKVRPV